MARTVSRWLLTAMFVSIGVLHFVVPRYFEHIMPPFLPYPHELVLVSGFFEIAGGIGVQIPKLRKAAGWGLLALLVAVFPANIYMAVAALPMPDGTPIHPAVSWGRLPFQFLFMGWVWRVAIEDEPARPTLPTAVV